MKLQGKLVTKAGGFVMASLARQWMGTLDYRVAYYDPTVDPACDDLPETGIYVMWHEFILFPFYLRGHCNISLLLSRHRDAEWLSEAAKHMGFSTIRGSTFRGGSTALRELARQVETMNIAITPDGPRGPRRTLAQGAIYLASTLQKPLIAMGFGYDRPWRMNTWDKFAIPRPFSRARAVVSPRLYLPPKLDRDGLEHYRQHVEALLNRMTDEAEAWAASGTGKSNEVRLTRKVKPRRLWKDDPHAAVPAPHFLRKPNRSAREQRLESLAGAAVEKSLVE